MIKEVATIRAGRQQKRDNSSGLSVLWLLILLLALLGAIVAAGSNAPVIWMLAWPAPLIVIFTAARFIAEGYHKRDGVLVLGRPMTSQPSEALDLSDDKAQDQPSGEVEPRIAIAESLSVLGPSGRIELSSAALHSATSQHAGEGRKRLEKRWYELKRSLVRS
jgi:hypothetical protein